MFFQHNISESIDKISESYIYIDKTYQNLKTKLGMPYLQGLVMIPDPRDQGAVW